MYIIQSISINHKHIDKPISNDKNKKLYFKAAPNGVHPSTKYTRIF